MRLIKQSKLFYCEGTSDKAYEVDLCEAGAGEFIVNIRYGRRGSRLREGTKTPYPLDLSKAEAIYDRLVAEKVRKGYAEVGQESQQQIASEEGEGSVDEFATQAQITAILARLNNPREEAKSTWPLSRVIWRAGVLEIRKALQPFVGLVSSLSKLEAYAMAWAVGRIGSSEGLGVIEKLEQKFSEEIDVLRMLREAKFSCLSEDSRDQFLADLRSGFSQEWEEKTSYSQVLFEFLMSDSFAQLPDAASGFDKLYLLARADVEVRGALYQFAKEHPFKEGTFHLQRRLYKTAEFRRDAEIYGVLANRFEFEKTKAVTSWQQTGRDWNLVKSGVFGANSKKYLRRRAVRNLEQMAVDGDVGGYIALATGILLGVDTDTPENTAQHSRDWIWDANQRRMITVDIYAPRYGQLYAFTWITSGTSPHLELSHKGARYRYQRGLDPKLLTGAEREEPNAGMWDQAPDAVIHLLKHGQVQEVHDFALKVWRDNPTFAEEANIEDVIGFIRSRFIDTQRLGMQLAVNLWNPEAPSFDLISALICSGVDEARDLGLEWFTAVLDQALERADFIAAILLVNDRVAHERLRGILIGKVWEVEIVVNEIAKALLKADIKEAFNGKLVAETLCLLAPDSLSKVEPSAVYSLLQCNDEGCQWFAVQALKCALQSGAEIDAEKWLLAIESPYSSVREIGVSLLLEVSDQVLVNNADLVASCCLSPEAEIRKGVQPVVARLSQLDERFSKSMVLELYPYVLRKERFEGLHQDVLEILVGPLHTQLEALPLDTFRGLLQSKYAAAHTLGHMSLLLETKLEDEPLLQVIEWANHEHAALRSDVLEHLRANENRLLMQLSEVRPLVESRWDEVKEYAFDFLRDRVPEGSWNVETLVNLCDSTDVLVQDFGREMITRRFRAEDGELYLTKLSQHPTREMQLFATHFLRQHAAGQAELILSLEMYFRTVLGAINAGRVAKLRVFDFLLSEGLKAREVGALAMELFTHHAASCAIADREECITGMLELQAKWQDMKLQYKAMEVPVWSGNN